MKLYLYDYCDEHKSLTSANLHIADVGAKAIVDAIIEDLYGDVVYFDGYKDEALGLEALKEVLGITNPMDTAGIVFTDELVRRLNTGLQYAMLREVETGEKLQ